MTRPDKNEKISKNVKEVVNIPRTSDTFITSITHGDSNAGMTQILSLVTLN